MILKIKLDIKHCIIVHPRKKEKLPDLMRVNDAVETDGVTLKRLITDLHDVPGSISVIVEVEVGTHQSRQTL